MTNPTSRRRHWGPFAVGAVATAGVVRLAWWAMAATAGHWWWWPTAAASSLAVTIFTSSALKALTGTRPDRGGERP